MTVYRTTPLPLSASCGRLIVPESIAAETLRSLRDFYGDDGQHEGLVYWAGRRDGDDALVATTLVPVCDHSPQRVIAPEREIGRLSRAARSMGVCLVAQVHSHPGSDTRHSDGDDHLILMPHEGFFSLVIANYGNGEISQQHGAGLHQFQQGRWIQIPPESSAMIIVPPVIRTTK